MSVGRQPDKDSGLGRWTYPLIRTTALPLHYDLLEEEARAIKGDSGALGAGTVYRMAVERVEACRSDRLDEIGSLVSGMHNLEGR